MAKPFHFKEFSIQQDRCAMKIGTDGVLLGAWTSLEGKPNSILDIGAGTGVIALMMAQRSSAELIDAIEIDENAYEQCVENFEESIWNDRLFCYHASLEEFVEEIDETYDVIISNPPFHEENYQTPDTQRNKARFTDSLPTEELLKSSAKLLANNGILAIIIPHQHEEKFLKEAKKHNLFPQQITHIKGNETSPIKRSLLQLGKKKQESKSSTLVLEKERNIYTEEYQALVRDFYLNL
ncbi:tRNA1(Val) (adenine(37)-N6)-methyltransferase [Mesonia maritima]|uniref:tRNA1(Val) (adenine(37)-N6)-methyltransferase n=1 Tax=Mesonia maritima TaxID=1793873 RepID=A0ABU1K1G2_9FLAO|nr:methyltransferase [Mesonia maritima]MDR6299433.1 tRNA1Val (adenine37-N6)-methyltransferase [Mesonia maritima]